MNKLILLILLIHSCVLIIAQTGRFEKNGLNEAGSKNVPIDISHQAPLRVLEYENNNNQSNYNNYSNNRIKRPQTENEKMRLAIINWLAYELDESAYNETTEEYVTTTITDIDEISQKYFHVSGYVISFEKGTLKNVKRKYEAYLKDLYGEYSVQKVIYQGKTYPTETTKIKPDLSYKSKTIRDEILEIYNRVLEENKEDAPYASKFYFMREDSDYWICIFSSSLDGYKSDIQYVHHNLIGAESELVRYYLGLNNKLELIDLFKQQHVIGIIVTTPKYKFKIMREDIFRYTN